MSRHAPQRKTSLSTQTNACSTLHSTLTTDQPHAGASSRVITVDKELASEGASTLPSAVRSTREQLILSTRCQLGDVRLWEGDPSTFSCLVSRPLPDVKELASEGASTLPSL